MKLGDRVPDFTLDWTEGGKISLAQLLERGSLVVAFFPLAFTPG